MSTPRERRWAERHAERHRCFQCAHRDICGVVESIRSPQIIGITVTACEMFEDESTRAAAQPAEDTP